MAVLPKGPAGPIQTIPQGLLGLLQLKELGQNPGIMLDTVAPNIDLFQLYAQRLIQGSNGLFQGQVSTVPLVNGNHGFQQLSNVNQAAVVPGNETWWVYMFECDIVAQNAADFVSGAPCIQMPNSRPVLLAPIYADVVSARARSWITNPITSPVWVPPLTNFGVYLVDILAGTNLTIFGEVRAVRVPI